jgi:hypothetical protein
LNARRDGEERKEEGKTFQASALLNKKLIKFDWFFARFLQVLKEGLTWTVLQVSKQ